MRNEEEIKSAVYYFTLLNETLVNVSSLRWVIDKGLASTALSLLEESLTYSLVNDNQGNLRSFKFRGINALVLKNVPFIGNDAVQLV